MYDCTVRRSASRLSSLPDASKNACCSASGCSWYSTTVIVVAVTPGAVAPPLSPPFHGATHGGAYPLGTATLPVVVSQSGPQATCLLAAFASSKVIGGLSEGARAADACATAGAVAATIASAHTTAIGAASRRRDGVAIIELLPS